ncbi:hypothetical protein HYT84_02820 [Candidatus Micrarchaeota archaeon]|nr:hypothetical protein [Candidatus Micrarchaeota archaeon]
MSIVEFGEFKGNKMITMKRDENDKYPFSFGKAKAKLIVENFEEIKKFAYFIHLKHPNKKAKLDRLNSIKKNIHTNIDLLPETNPQI